MQPQPLSTVLRFRATERDREIIEIAAQLKGKKMSSLFREFVNSLEPEVRSSIEKSPVA